MRVSTTNYAPEARRRLAEAVVLARTAAGYPFRPGFVAAARGVNAKSLELLERAQPGVGQKFLHALARALPGWREDTPREILEGGDAPPLASPEPAIPDLSPVVGEPPDYSNLPPAERRRIIRRSIDQLPLALDVSQAAYEVVREGVIRLIVAYEPREGDE